MSSIRWMVAVGLLLNVSGQVFAQTNDDFAMMREVLTRRFARAIKEDPDRAAGQWPDLILIDGGQGRTFGVSDFTEFHFRKSV